MFLYYFVNTSGQHFVIFHRLIRYVSRIKSQIRRTLRSCYYVHKNNTNTNTTNIVYNTVHND